MENQTYSTIDDNQNLYEPSIDIVETDVNNAETTSLPNEEFVELEGSDGSDIEIVAISENLIRKRKNGFRKSLRNPKRTKIYVNSVDCSMKGGQESYIKEEIIISDGSDGSDNDCNGLRSNQDTFSTHRGPNRISNRFSKKRNRNNDSLSSITLNCPRCNKTDIVYSVTIRSKCKDCKIDMYYVCTSCNCRYETLPALFRHKKLQCKSALPSGKTLGAMRSFFRKCSRCDHKQKEWRTTDVLTCPNCKVEMMYECMICNKNYSSYSGLYMHARNQCQSSLKLYYCNDCDYKCSIQKFLTRHLRRKHTKLYGPRLSCPKCKKGFEKQSRLKHHLLNCEMPAYRCKFCPFRPKFLYRLKEHLVHHHEEEIENENLDSLLSEAEKNRSKSKESTVTTPDAEHKEELDLQKLKLVYCPTCEVSIPHIPGLYNCKECKSPLRFECGRCLKFFNSRASLYRHIRRQHGKLIHTCSNCNRSFSFYGDANEHRKSCGQAPRFQCEICYFRTRYKYNLRCHMSKLHNENRESFVCGDCGNVYKTFRSLDKHQKNCYPSQRG